MLDTNIYNFKEYFTKMINGHLLKRKFIQTLKEKDTETDVKAK